MTRMKFILYQVLQRNVELIYKREPTNAEFLTPKQSLWSNLVGLLKVHQKAKLPFEKNNGGIHVPSLNTYIYLFTYVDTCLINIK